MFVLNVVGFCAAFFLLIFDGNGAGHAGDQTCAGWDMVEFDADGYALGEADPGEGWVDIGEQVGAFAAFGVNDAGGEAGDVAGDWGAAVQQCDRGGIADGDMAEFGFLEITIDVERVGIDDGEHGVAGADIVAGAHGEIGDDAVDGRAYGTAGQVELGDGLIGGGFVVLGLGFQGLAGGLVARLAGDGIVGEAGIALGVALGVVHRGFGLGDGGLRLAQSEGEAEGVDLEKRLAGDDGLVVLHEDFYDRAGDVRRQLHRVGTHTTVAGPGVFHVIDPKLPGDDDGDGGNDQRDDKPEREGCGVHGKTLFKNILSWRR
jgi:hypothetical protein